ncbi:Nucleolar pre-ribosomal-associated protein 1 [Frankliniella fusca]|uniref:Nucleolar pre-ribosomal-associated protein 1 n=1 Tax=Frankliniella fusca TaxID=407009 RepID=A0AAE1GX98_9NEOP|nr:Nucleolar pre-ribosomal-associated protein 1 [Frankliniella fusca]
MGVKVKRKAARALDESAAQIESTETSSSEPPNKKSKVLSPEEFIKSLRGPHASESVKQWLYLISNQKEQAQMDKDLSRKIPNPNVEDNVKVKIELQDDIEGTESTDKPNVDEEEDLEEGLGNEAAKEEEEGLAHIDAFLSSGGSVADIVYTLPSAESAHASHLRHVFRVLYKILLRISAEHQDRIPEAVEVCRDLVNTYLKQINDMLTIQRSPRERICNLELLTAMSALDAKFAKEILNTISLEAEIADHLTSPRVAFTVRLAYLKFLIALLIDADIPLIMSVVNKPWMLSSVWEGLQYDPSHIVVLLLMTIKKTILENKSVPKSAKQIIFNTDGIISLLHLYKWKGPQNRPKSLTFWAMKKMGDKPKLLAEIDSIEAETVADAVQELLIVLLTDHRFGIIFRDTAIAHQSDRHNKMVSRVLERIGHPWENPKVAKLVSKVLAACPDSLRSTLTTMKPFIRPRSSEKWFNCVKFLKMVLEDQCPEEVLLRQVSWLTMMQLGAAAIEMCSPSSVLSALCSDNADALYTDDIAVARGTVELLVCMLSKIYGFTEVVRQWASNGILSYAQSTAFCRHVSDNMLKNVPRLNSIQKAWNLWSEKCKVFEPANVESDKPTNILSFLLELLEIYHKLCPSLLDTLQAGQSELKMAMTATVLETTRTEEGAQLRNRLYRLLLAINDQDFSAENMEMKEPMQLIVKDLISHCTTVRSLAWSVLQSLVRRAGTLEGSPQESVVWLSVFQETYMGQEELSKEVIGMLVESILRACSQCPKYLDIIARSEEGAAEFYNEDPAAHSSHFDEGLLEELLEDASENAEQQTNFHRIHFNSVSISSWLPCFLEIFGEYLEEKKIRKKSRPIAEEFCCKLILRLLYRLPHPGSFLHLLLKTYSNIIPAKLTDYLQCWLPGGSPQLVQPHPLGENSAELKLGKFLFFDAGSKTELRKLFITLSLPTVDTGFTGNETDLRRLEVTGQIVQLVYFVAFHLTQLAQLQKLTEDFVIRSQNLLLFISEIASHYDSSYGKGKEQGLFFEVFKVIFCHPILFQQFNPLAKHNTESSTFLTNLMITLSKTALGCLPLENYLMPYKDKLLLVVESLAKKKKKKMPKGNIASMISAFPLKFEEVSNLLQLTSDLPFTSIVTGSDEKTMLSPWFHLTAHLFSCASHLRNKGSSTRSDIMILPSEVVSQASCLLLKLLPSENCDATLLVEAFMSYIESCPQQTAHVSESLLQCMLNSCQANVATCKLAQWVASCTSAKDLLNVLKGSIKDKYTTRKRLGLILPVVRVALRKEEKEGFWKSVLTALYDQTKSEIQESAISLANHPEWLASNSDVVLLLMKRFMKLEDRESICKALEKKAPALTEEKQYYLEFITEVLQIHPPQLLLLLLAWLGVTLKKRGDTPQQSGLFHLLNDAIVKFTREIDCDDFSSVKESKVWQETLRLALKLGLSNGKGDEESGDKAPDESWLLLKTLHSLFKKMYSPNHDHEHVKMVHSMTIQHSDFLNIMMGSSPSKFELVQLLYVLLERSPKIMESSHVPVLLASYSASLSKIDRSILKILMLYEQSGIDLSQYRPYFWGRQGANHYSIWSEGTRNTKSLLQQPRPDQVLGLIDINMVMQTIGQFSIHSTLTISEDETEFADGIYDPSFCLPLFMYLLSPESPVLTHTFVRSGALALTLSALASYDVTIRAAAYTTLSRFISHLQMAKGRNKELLLHFMSALQKGVIAFGGENPRLPSLVSVFLSRSAIEISNPSSPLYRPLINFILAKPAMNLRTVPEFLQLLHSDHVDHLAHRHWILEVLAEGTRTPIDVDLCTEAAAYKLLLSYYSTCLSDSKSKLLILRWLRSTMAIQYGACRLVRDFSIISWLHQTIINLTVENFTLITEMVRLLSNLWGSVSAPTKGKLDSETGRQIPHIENSASKVLPLLLTLHLKLTPQTGVDILINYISVLTKVASCLRPEETPLFSKDSLMSILEVGSAYCCNKREFFDLLEFGHQFTEVKEISLDRKDKASEFRLLLRTLTIQWSKCQASNHS